MPTVLHTLPREFRVCIGAVLLAALGLCLVAQDAWSKSGEASFSLEVPAGVWKGARLKNIPKRAELALEIQTDGPIEILLLGEEDYARFPAPTKSLFRGKTSDKLSVSVLAPETGHYYVLIDNRAGDTPRSIQMTLRGETREAGGLAGNTQASLRKFEEQLHSLFQFESFPVDLENCPKTQVFGESSGMALCQAYVRRLHEHFQDKEKTEDVLLFTLLHGIGHVLLEQWNYPTYDSEETADQFAAVLLAMLNQKERLRAQAAFFHANASAFEAIAKAFEHDRHALSGRRARGIQRWADDEDLVRRWQVVFVPRMQTPVLEQLKRTPTAWTDLALVEQELATRR